MLYYELLFGVMKGFFILCLYFLICLRIISTKRMSKWNDWQIFASWSSSTVYKFINGKREPISAELVEDLAQYIKLTPTETQQFKEAWKMARMGEDTYYIRKSIEHFLCDFPNKSNVSVRSFTPPPMKIQQLLSPSPQIVCC